jgi:hypothetical protein
MPATSTTIRDITNEQDFEMQSRRPIYTGRKRVPEPAGIARLAMRATALALALMYLAFFIYYGAFFKIVIPAAFVAVSLIQSLHISLK